MATPTSSLTSLVQYLGDGMNRDFTFSFPYLDPSHVHAFVDEAEVSYSYVTQQVVRLNSTPIVGAIVEIRRITPSVQIAPIPDGGVVTTELLQTNEDQARYIAEEARDLAEPALRYNAALGAYDAKGRRIARVGTATADNDALTLAGVDTAVAKYLGTDALAALVQSITDTATKVHDDRVDVDTKAAQVASNLATAQALETLALQGPSGQELARRISEYLGTDAWATGGDSDGGGTVPTAGAHRYWRLTQRKPLPFGNGSSVPHSIDRLEFRSVAGTSQVPTGGTPLYAGTGSGIGWGGDPTAIFGASPDNAFIVATQANFDAQNPWVGYHFTAPISVAEFCYRAHNTGFIPWQMVLDYSDDGLAWTATDVYTAPQFVATWVDTLFASPVAAAAGSHAYWRLRFTQASLTQGILNLREVQFRKVAGTAQPMNADGTGSITPPPVSSWSVVPIVDGDVGTSASCAIIGYDGGGTNHPTNISFTQVFTTAQVVAEVAVTLGDTLGPGQGIAVFTVAYSDDGAAWTSLPDFVSSSWSSNETKLFATPSAAPPGSTAQFVFDANGTFHRPAKGRIAFVQCWGAGGADNGGGGGYAERYFRLQALPLTVDVTVGLGIAHADGDPSSFGGLVSSFGGEKGTPSLGGRGATPLGVGKIYNGEGLGGNATTLATGGIDTGGGGTTSGAAGNSLYGGGGGGLTKGTSYFAGNGGNGTDLPVQPAGGGGLNQKGADGRVTVTVW